MTFAIVIIGVALVFDFYNGMHDAANSIATVVSTRVLTPLQGVIWAAVFNFAAAFVFGVSVAATIGKGLILPSVVDNAVIFSALVGGVITSAWATHNGQPISISHAIIGGLGGAAVAKGGFGVLIVAGYAKVLTFVFLAPLIGMTMSYIFSIITLWAVRNRSPRGVNKAFRKLQLFSAAWYSLSHGSNDAQKTMGIIAMVLFSNRILTGPFFIPLWVEMLSYSVISFGTLWGGWKVIKTLGHKMTKLTPFGGFSAETSAACTIIGATLLGVPVSTTQTITGAIIGVGAVKGVSAVRWGVARSVVWAWVLTIPISSAIAVAAYNIMRFIGL
jgi:inorganic phosphate transporter, PiT family